MADLAQPTRPKSPWQLVYGAAHAARRRYWRGRANRLPRPVVSIGNLCWGGGGKTPLVAAVAAHLSARGLAVAILSRGYRGSYRETGDEVRIVSTGEGPLVGPAVAGDEPVLLAGELPGVALLVGRDRYRAGLYALAHLDPPPEVFLLDDGFSHLGLARDLDLLVFPADDPFAGGRLFPGGRLREPLAAAAAADAALLTGEIAGDPRAAAARLAAALAPHSFRGTTFAAPTRVDPPRFVGGERSGEALAAGERVLLVSGIARPRAFAAAARAAGLELAGELAYGDHHAYPARSLAEIAARFRETGAAAVLTTAKDRVKLAARLDLPLAELPIRAEPEPAFWDWLAEALPLAGGEARRGTGR